MEYCLSLNPTIDKTLILDSFTEGGTNRAASVRRDAGGKALNVAVVLKALGRNPHVVGINSKEDGELIREALEARSIFYDFHDVDGNARENTKIFDRAAKRVTEINEPAVHVGADLLGRIGDELVDTVDHGQTAVLAGALPEGADPGYYGDLVRRLKDKDVRVVVDTSGEALRKAAEAGPFMIKPNLDELSELAGKKLTTLGDVDAVCKELEAKYGIEVIVVSFGSKGAFLRRGSRSMYAKPLELDVKSTVGAGDSILAGAVAFADSDSLEMLRAGSAAAAGTVTLEGTELCSRPLFDTYYAQVHVDESPDASIPVTERL